MSERQKFRVRWWMWGILTLATLGMAVDGALSHDAPRAIYSAVLCAFYGFLTGVRLMVEDEERA